MKCPDKMAPDIHSATWGRQDGATCPPEDDSMDCSIDVTSIVAEKCSMKKCAFIPNKRTLGEPCPGSGKLIIKVDYDCRPIPPTTTPGATTPTQPPTTTTPVTSAPTGKHSFRKYDLFLA